MVRPRTLSSVASRAVRKMIGTSARWAPRRWATSKPSMSGSITSSTSRWGRNEAILASASAPVPAVSTPNPWKRRAMATTSTMLGSSSTTRTRCFGCAVVSATSSILAAPAVVQSADRAHRGAVLLHGLHRAGGAGAPVVARAAKALGLGQDPADPAVVDLPGQPGQGDGALATGEAPDAAHVRAAVDDRRRGRGLAGHDDGPAAVGARVGHRLADAVARAERAAVAAGEAAAD